jgi:hypothetical protein
MIKTQVQLPDALYHAAKELAARKEWSLAEVVRRGLENILCTFPASTASTEPWKLPEPRPLGGDAFFDNPDWRYELNQANGAVRETRSPYRTKRKSGRA